MGSSWTGDDAKVVPGELGVHGDGVGPHESRPGRMAWAGDKIRTIYWRTSWSGVVSWKQVAPGVAEAVLMSVCLGSVILNSFQQATAAPSLNGWYGICNKTEEGEGERKTNWQE